MTSIFEYNKEEEEKKLRRAEYELGVEDGVKIGIGQGMERGREETKKETAISLAGMGMPVKDIAQVVKESIECVQEWVMQQRTI